MFQFLKETGCSIIYVNNQDLFVLIKDDVYVPLSPLIIDSNDPVGEFLRPAWLAIKKMKEEGGE